MSGLSYRQRTRRARRPDLDRTAVRYFIYRLVDGDGVVLYVGRSCNPAARIRQHVAESDAHMATGGLKSKWVPRVRNFSLLGPYTWDEACRVERAEIEAHQPTGNRMFTERYGWRRRAS